MIYLAYNTIMAKSSLMMWQIKASISLPTELENSRSMGCCSPFFSTLSCHSTEASGDRSFGRLLMPNSPLPAFAMRSLPPLASVEWQDGVEKKREQQPVKRQFSISLEMEALICFVVRELLAIFVHVREFMTLMVILAKDIMGVFKLFSYTVIVAVAVVIVFHAVVFWTNGKLP